mgnify:CR=1 FL=1|tara:strand:- start:448 stop:588 length:141 start_codon:yes stop_codon:yes gene_type:complete
MTKSEFMYECGKRLIEPSIALENESIEAALLARDYEKVVSLLDNEF